MGEPGGSALQANPYGRFENLRTAWAYRAGDPGTAAFPGAGTRGFLQRIAGATPFDFLLLLNHRMISPTELFVDGTFRPSASRQRTTLINPATEEPFAEIARADLSDVNNARSNRLSAWTSGWRDLAPGKREAVSHAVARKLREHLEEIAQLETLHIGKPISDARDEAALGARVFEYYAGAVTKFCGQTIPVGRGGFDLRCGNRWVSWLALSRGISRSPIGCWKAAPALAAGNCVVLKPASMSPLTALKLGELAHDAGLPAGVLQVLPGAGRPSAMRW